MKCAYGHEDNACIDTRQVGFYRRRRYLCGSCGAKFTTYEIDHSLFMAANRAINVLSLLKDVEVNWGDYSSPATDKEHKDFVEKLRLATGALQE